MEKSRIRKEISDLINSIKEHSDNIGNKKNIPQLELELILSKIEKLYEKSIVFNYLHSIPEKNAEQVNVSSLVSESFENITANETSKEPIQTQIPLDLFASDTHTENEHSLADKLGRQAIKDLKDAIGINEKFQFINELFEGHMQEYNAALSQLNNMTEINEAKTYLNTLKALYHWKDNTISSAFIDLVERKFL